MLEVTKPKALGFRCQCRVDSLTVTLVVGKNNAEKTTIVQALEKLVNRND